MTRLPDDQSPRPAGAEAPADDLGDVWGALDALPRAESSIDMAATTIDMVAVAVDGAGDKPSSGGAHGPGLRRWLLPVAAVTASLVAGIVAGRVTTSDPDVRVLEYLPLIRHLGILQEAGSVTFLKAVAERKLPAPLWLPGGDLRSEMREFDEAIASLEADHVWGNAAAERLAARRDEILALSGARRDELERSVTTFVDLSGAQRRDLAAVATALADPKLQDLRDAARTWHLWVAASDPPDRRNIVELDTAGRIEWLDRRPRLRERDRGGERRGPPGGIEGLPGRGLEGRPWRPGMGPGTGEPPGFGDGLESGPGPRPRGAPPRPREAEGRGDDRPPPPVSPPPSPPETRAAPR
jgi:hypothetical protein